jgi:hypothetical protein
MKANEIIYYIQNLRQKGLQSDDNQISDDMVFFSLNNKRDFLLRQEEERYNSVNPEIAQTLSIELEPSHLIDLTLCDIRYKEICVLKSKLPIPLTINLKTSNNYLYLGGMDGKSPYTYSEVQTLKYLVTSKYTGNKTKYLVMNSYLYIINPPSNALRYVKMIALFHNPKEAKEFIDLTEGKSNIDIFDPYDFEYPITGNMLETVYAMMLDKDIRYQVSTKDDTLQDGKNEQ